MPNESAAMNVGQSRARWRALEPVIASPATDPRSDMDDQALVLATRNAYPIVAQRKPRQLSPGLAAGAATALMLGCVTFVSLSSSRNSGRAQPAAESVASAPLQAAPIERPSAAAPLSQSLPTPAVDSLASPATVATPMGMSVPAAPRGDSPVLVFDGSGAAAKGPAAGEEAGSAQVPGMFAQSSESSSAADADSGAARATQISDPANTVVQGTLIPAVLETAINSDIPGYVRAVVSSDVRSFDGTKVLVPRSSRLIGEYKTGISAGQKRAYLIWTRLLRPDGVSVELASPSVDFSGQSGIGGHVNSHFLQRFGSAILLSVLGGATAMASGGSTVVVAGGQSAASIAAQRDGGRAPTITVRPGEPIRVFTARDLIFSVSKRGGV
jgi:type IV secretion system protein VirB10